MSGKTLGLDRLRALIGEATNRDVPEIRVESRLSELGLESIDRIRIIVLLEREHGIEIDEATATRLETVGDLLSHVSSRSFA